MAWSCGHEMCTTVRVDTLRPISLDDLLACADRCMYVCSDIRPQRNSQMRVDLVLVTSPAGMLDASLKLDRSLTQPIVGGDVRLSRGTAFLMPQVLIVTCAFVNLRVVTKH